MNFVPTSPKSSIKYTEKSYAQTHTLTLIHNLLTIFKSMWFQCVFVCVSVCTTSVRFGVVCLCMSCATRSIFCQSVYTIFCLYKLISNICVDKIRFSLHNGQLTCVCVFIETKCNKITSKKTLAPLHQMSEWVCMWNWYLPQLISTSGVYFCCCCCCWKIKIKV